jgi:hypothetical protein
MGALDLSDRVWRASPDVLDHVSLRVRSLLAVGVTATLATSAFVESADAPDASAAPSESPIVTDRPTDSASPVLVPRHTLQIEAGYKFTRLDDESGRTDDQKFPDLLARFGISERVEVRLTATGWTFLDQTSGTENGFNDLSLGAKIALGDERGRRPQMALLADVSLPVGAVGFTDDYVIPKVLFLATHTLTDRLGLTWNLGPSFVTTKTDDVTRTDVTLNYAVALAAAAGGRVSLFGEVYGAFAFGEDRPDRHAFQAGATVLVTRTFQLDVRAGFGMVDNEPDWLAGAGLAFRLPH